VVVYDGPDACRSDRLAPCFYWHLKLAALNGGWDKLADEERAFVGVDVSSRDDASGWIQGSSFDDALAKAYDSLGMAPPQERIEFLG
jgi:hypothetical protein